MFKQHRPIGMMCYKDKTFCTFYKECKQGETCHRAFTDEVHEAAVKWWGNDKYPACFFAEHPECFENKSES